MATDIMCLSVHGGGLACGGSKDPTRQAPNQIGWTARKDAVTCGLCRQSPIFRTGVEGPDGLLMLPPAPAPVTAPRARPDDFLPGIDE